MPETSRARRRALAVIAAAVPMAAALIIAPLTSTAAPAPPSGWTTVFADDFNGSAGSAPSSNWIYDLGTGYPGGAGNWGTGEVETMTNNPANVSLDGAGHLSITPIRAANGSWTSARIETARTDFAAPAGGQMQISASLRQPNPATGVGYWPAFWALGAAARPVGATNWPSIGELDVMEDVNGLSSVSHALHCGVDPGGPCNETTGIGSGLIGCGNCQSAYHTYSVVVDRRNTSAEQLRFYTDSTLELTVNESQVGASTWAAAVDHGFFLILNVAMGGGFPNAICGCGSPTGATSSGAAMSVDWVQVTTTGGGTPPPTSPPPTSPPPGGGTSATSTIQAEADNAQSGTQTETTTDSGGGQDVGWIANGDWLRYDNVNFGSSGLTQFKARVASGAAGGVSGLVEVHLDSLSNPSIGSFALANTGGWQSWRTVPANITRTTGTHTVYLKFTSGQPADFVNINWFTFAT